MKKPGKGILDFRSKSRRDWRYSAVLDPQSSQNAHMYRPQSGRTPSGVNGVYVGHATCDVQSGALRSGARCRRRGMQWAPGK